MANSLSLQIINVGSTSSIYINDIHDGKDQNGRVNNRKPYQYIPANGAVTILFTEQVQYSYESGAIRSFIDQGLIQTFFVHGDLNYTSTDENGLTNHLNVTFQEGLYEIAGPYDPAGALDFTGTDISIHSGVSNGAGQLGGALNLNAGASLNGNGGSIDIRGGEGEVNGGGVYIYGNRGSTGTAGKVSIVGVHYYGSQDFTIPDGLNNGEITFTVAGAFIIGTNLIILNVFAPPSVDINTPPVTYEINPGVNFKARLKATNGSGDPVGCKLFWVCI
jgi:hypothetical protein